MQLRATVLLNLNTDFCFNGGFCFVEQKGRFSWGGKQPSLFSNQHSGIISLSVGEA